jgi:hypothetical protein
VITALALDFFSLITLSVLLLIIILVLGFLLVIFSLMINLMVAGSLLSLSSLIWALESLKLNNNL